ncbi:MAG: 16S rRNA (uracil(1498)-N(3))-methyltransferase [Pseudomonadota bacterium]
MPRTRLYIPAPLAGAASLDLTPEQAHYLGRVLRMKPGEALTVFDGRGSEFAAVVQSLGKSRARLDIGAARDGNRESHRDVRLIQGVSRGERMDFVVQKATELGVTSIQPVMTERTVVRLDDDRRTRRHAHWQRIAIGACEQCGRSRLPDILPPVSLADYLANDSDATLRATLSPQATERLADAKIPDHGAAELLVGPEGGLSRAEREHAHAAGFASFCLGPRVLRSETAALAAVTIVQTFWGDL